MRPLLMIHGINSNARETFGVPGKIFRRPRSNSMYSCLTQHGYRAGKDLFWYSYPTWRPISLSAKRLREEIDRVKKITGCSRIDLLTFSLGGIIGKYYTVSSLYNDEIGKMVMIAPPFLGSRWVDWFRIRFRQDKEDLLFPGDGKALSAQVLGYNNPFLRELAGAPFPPGIDTTIIAVKAVIAKKTGPIWGYASWLAGKVGEGDFIVPVESAKIPVNHYFEVQFTGFYPTTAKSNK